MCFYQSYAREIAEANGWKRLATNSAKMVNILGGYGYRPMLASMEALRGRPPAPGSGDADAGDDGELSRPPRMGRTRAGRGAGRHGRLFGALRPRPIDGVFSRPAHKLAGQSYVGKILVLDTAKGGVATAWMLHEMESRGMVPLALVFNSVNPILAQGAALGGVPMLAGFDLDITAAIPHGAVVEIDPQTKTLRVVQAGQHRAVTAG